MQAGSPHSQLNNQGKINMRIFVTGATGFVGSAVVQELIGAGHQVLGLARSDEGAAALTAVGADVHRGSLEELDSLRSGAAVSDGVIHCAFIHDFSKFEENCEKDRNAITAIGEVLAGSDRPFVITSGTAGVSPGKLGTETSVRDSNSPASHRLAAEDITLSFAAQGVRAAVLRLPPSVHGVGDHGFVPMLINIARQKGVAGYIGEGFNHWPAVHRLDAARLYRLAIEKAPVGSILHGVGDQGVPTKEIAAVIGKHLNLPIVSIPAAEAGAHFGFLGGFFAIDCPASSAITQELLEWSPVQPGLIEDLDQDHYFG
jgi:nucleoside-diphosphate-sugar epimerase